MVDSLKQSLPPKVFGPIHGYLDLKIDQVIWTRRTNCAVKIRVHWWGQDQTEFLFRLGNKHEKTLYSYAIQTTYKLFRNYLMNCLGLTLSVIDEQMGTLIGTCVLKNLHLIIIDETPHEDFYPILNEYDSQIGKLRVGFRLCFLSNSSTSKISSKSCDSLSRDRHLKVNSLDSQYNNNSSDSDNIVSSKIVQKVLKQGQRLRNAMIETILDNDPLNKDVYNPTIVPKLDIHSRMCSARNQNLTEFDKNTRVFDYLTGANVSPLEEEQILNTIRTISPTTSMIKLASDLHFQNTYDTMAAAQCAKSAHPPPVSLSALPPQPPVVSTSSVKICNDKKFNYRSASQSIVTNNEKNLLSFVDSLKIYVYNLKLNSAGWRKILGTEHKIALNRAPTFFVEFVIPQLLSEDLSKSNVRKTKINSNVTNQVTRFCSKKVINEVIHFKQQSVHKIVNIESLNLSNLILELKIFSRNVSQRGATPVGIAKCNLSDVIDQENFTCDEELVVIDTNKPLGIGTLKIRLQFGCDKIHFGKEFIEAITCEKENRKLSYSDSLTKELDHVEVVTNIEPKPKKVIPNIHPILSKPTIVPQKEMQKKHPNLVFTEYQLATNLGSTLKLLQCLIYIPEIQFETDHPKCTFLVCRAFWREDTTISKLCYHTQRAVYNFREVVPLLYDSEFLSRSKNNYLIIEVWENDGNTESFLGICKLPLHQLYVAYRDPKVAYHLAEGKLPVIAFDGWEDIIHPISLNRTGQLQALLAVGTEIQVQSLELSRGINEPSVGKLKSSDEINDLRKQSARSIPKPTEHNENLDIHEELAVQTNIRSPKKETVRNFEESTQTEEPRNEKQLKEFSDKAIQTYISQSTQTDLPPKMDSSKEMPEGNNNPNITRSNLLESFMDLANKLPIQQKLDQSSQVNIPLENKSTEMDNMPQMQDTSKLFEVLQKVLQQPPTNPEKSTFRAHIVIESAVHLAIRRRRIKTKGKHTKKHIEVMPTTYVSFEPIPETGLLFTSIIPKSTNPRWNQHFECQIPRDMLYDDQKRLIFKVWNKNGTDFTQPNIVTDSVIGFAALDLTVLPAGLPNIQGWFNIMDFSSHCNGQIKINLTPLEDILKKHGSSTSTEVISLPLFSPPSDIFEITPSTSLLSNTLKRKFTELDEITERLKQRLMDVTKSDEDSDNNNEFEHDLNTEPPPMVEEDDFDFTKGYKSICPPNTGVSAISVADSGFGESKETTSADIEEIIDKKMKENKIQFDALFEKLSLHSMQQQLNADSMNNCAPKNSILENITEESTESTDLLANNNRFEDDDDELCDPTIVSSITLSSDNSLADQKLYEKFTVLNSESDLSSFDLNSEAILLSREAPEGAGNASTETLIQITKNQK